MLEDVRLEKLEISNNTLLSIFIEREEKDQFKPSSACYPLSDGVDLLGEPANVPRLGLSNAENGKY